MALFIKIGLDTYSDIHHLYMSTILTAEFGVQKATHC